MRIATKRKQDELAKGMVKRVKDFEKVSDSYARDARKREKDFVRKFQ